MTSKLWIWLGAALAVAFSIHGVSLIVRAGGQQDELRAFVVLVERLDALEESLHAFEAPITPVELLPGGAPVPEEEIWRRVLDGHRARAAAVRDADRGLPWIRRASSEVEAAVGRLADLRRRVVDTRRRSGDVTVPAVRYHQEMDHAASVIRTAIAQVRSETARISLDLAAHWHQLSNLVWVSCCVALLAAVLSGLYRRDLGRRRKAEADLARIHAELEHRVEERTAELSLTNALLVEQIRQRKRTEERLQRYADRLARSNAELQEFAYVASHDLQEPLRMVASYVQLLAKRYRGRLDADADEFMRYAVDGAERMKRLILDLLAYARVDSQDRMFERVDADEVLRGALLNLKVAIEESGAEITSGPLPAVVADPTQFAQLLQNLAGNAIKFRGVEPPRIHVSAETSGGEHLFRIRDNGVGIAPEHFDRIFRVFQRLDPGEHNSGTGIGLAICKKIVERHGGRIWVESSPGKGTTVLFTFPVQAQTVPVGAAMRSTQAPPLVRAPEPPLRAAGSGRI
jgi:signal transduction histidine kinase